MSQELIYTSTTKGLKLGSRGFCTVASTSGMAKNLADRLEALSGYKHLFSTGDPQAKLNPVNTSYLRFKLGGRVYYVLSRIADAGLDYTQRTNKLAHHVVLSREELAIAGPAWVASQGGFFQTIWEGEARILPSDRPIPQGDLQIGVCHAWARIVGDAGWAGVLAESILKRSSTEAYLVCKPGTDVLALFLEAQALLPPDKRWEATFSTYFTKVPPGVECRWRCAIDGTPEAVRARRSPEKLVIDLTAPLPAAEGGRLVVAARSGVLPELDEIETIQPVGGEVQQKTPALPPSVPPAEINLKVGPPVLPRQKEAVFRSAGHKVEEQSIWKVVAIISLLVIALIGGAFIRSIYSSRVPEPPLGHVSPEIADDQEDLAEGVNEVADSNKESGQNAYGNSEGSSSVEAPVTETDPDSGINGNMEDPADSELTSDASKDEGSGNKDSTASGDKRAPNLPVSPKFLDGISAFVELNKIPQSPLEVIDAWDKPIELGTLPDADHPLEFKLLGVPFTNNKSVVKVRPTDDTKKWKVVKVVDEDREETTIGEISIETSSSGKSGGAFVFFRWTKDAKNQKNAVGIVRNAILGVAVLQATELKPKYISFYAPVIASKKILFRRQFWVDGVHLHSLKELHVPDGQTVALLIRISGLPNKQVIKQRVRINVGGTQPLNLVSNKDKLMEVVFQLELRDTTGLNGERSPGISFRISIPSYPKKKAFGASELNRLFKNRRGLQRDLKAIVVEHVRNTREKWEEYDIPIQSARLETGKPGREYVNKSDVLSWYQVQLDNSNLLKIIGSLGHMPATRQFDTLVQHENRYEHLREYIKTIDELSNLELKLHVALMRLPVNHDKDVNEAAEVVFYFNDKSLIN